MGLLTGLETWLQGKKSYLIMVAAVLGSVIAYLNGELNFIQAMQALLVALGFGAARSAIAKIPK